MSLTLTSICCKVGPNYRKCGKGQHLKHTHLGTVTVDKNTGTKNTIEPSYNFNEYNKTAKTFKQHGSLCQSKKVCTFARSHLSLRVTISKCIYYFGNPFTGHLLKGQTPSVFSLFL